MAVTSIQQPLLPEEMQTAMTVFSSFFTRDRTGYVSDDTFWRAYLSFARLHGFFHGEDDRAHEYIAELLGAKRVCNQKTIGFDLYGVNLRRGYVDSFKKQEYTY